MKHFLKQVLCILIFVIMFLSIVIVSYASSSISDWEYVENIIENSSKSERIDYLGDVDYFKFIPSVSGCYSIEGEGIKDISGILYNKNGDEIAYPNDYNGREEKKFKIIEGLIAGETYYIECYSNTKIGTYRIKIENMHSDEVNLADLLHEAGATRNGNLISLNLYCEIKSSRNIGIRAVNGKEVVYIDEFSYELVPQSIIESKLKELEKFDKSDDTITDATNSFASVAQKNELTIKENSTTFGFTNTPFIENGRILVPARETFEALGVLKTKANWNPDTQTVLIEKGDIVIKFKINSDNAYVNGIITKLDVPAKIVNDITYVPLRFVVESLGAMITWDGGTNTAQIYTY